VIRILIVQTLTESDVVDGGVPAGVGEGIGSGIVDGGTP